MLHRVSLANFLANGDIWTGLYTITSNGLRTITGLLVFRLGVKIRIGFMLN